MKKMYVRILTAISALLFHTMTWGQTVTMTVTVSNDWTQAKTCEPVVINLHKAVGADALPWHVARAVVERDGRGVPCQIDDMDGDMRADELVFLTDIAAREAQTFRVTLYAEGLQASYPPRVYAHMSIGSKSETDISAFEALGTGNVFNSLYHHGACFESEMVGFRIYSDSRQNVDVYGKRQHRLELATTKFNSTEKHLADGYGHDVLWNGRSMACGTLRDWHEERGVLEVSDVKRRGQRILAYGPLRTVVEVSDIDWHGTLCCRTRYTLYAGHRDVAVEARFDTPLPEGQRFCTGVQKIGTNPQGILRADGIAASWGSDWPDYGKKQLYQEQSVGLAVCVPEEYIYNKVEDSLQYIFVLHAPRQHTFHYWLSCCADMEQDSPYHSAREWFAALDGWQEMLRHPVKVTVTADCWPDGTAMSSWFSDTTKVDINSCGRAYRVTDYGVKKDSALIQTTALQRVIDRCAADGGGVVVIPHGTFLTGALFFKRGTRLHLEKGARLKGIDDIRHYPLIDQHFEGLPVRYFAALVNADHVDNFSITGPGTIDGNARRFWDDFWLRRKQNPKCTNLEALRPQLVLISNSRDVTIQDVSLVNSAFWTNHLYRCERVRFLNCRIVAPTEGKTRAPSSDAIDLDVCNDVLVRGCYINTCDDGVCLKGGRGPYVDRDSTAGAVSHVLVEHCRFGSLSNAALTLGSDAWSCRNVVMRHCRMEGTPRMLLFKMRADTPQTFEYVRVEHCSGSVWNGVEVSPWTQFHDPQARPDMPPSAVRHVLLRDVSLRCTGKFRDVRQSGQYTTEDIAYENCNGL